MRIVTIVGARPQFVKAAVVSRALANVDRSIDERILHTGQHFDDNMSGVFFREMGIPQPSASLGIGGGAHGQMTGRMLESIEQFLMADRPDWVLVYGDTNSTIAGALAAAKLHIPVAHVEAGLRSFNRRMPEEVNRVLTDHISSLLFAPTTNAVSNLYAEGIRGDMVWQVGDVMFDAMLHYRARAEGCSEVLSRLGLDPRGYVLATVHRAENTDDPSRLTAILSGLGVLSEIAPVILPLHPRTMNLLSDDCRLRSPFGRVRVIEPVGYLDMLMLESNAGLVATDSGGLQKEAYFCGVPCITLRDETEWVELVECGANVLVGAHAERIASEGRARFGRSVQCEPLYGHGDAGFRVAEALTRTAGPADVRPHGLVPDSVNAGTAPIDQPSGRDRLQPPATHPVHSFATPSTGTSATPRGKGIAPDHPSTTPRVELTDGRGVTVNPSQR
jgi:UDP-GlcNAc3NAcA epimerase